MPLLNAQKNALNLGSCLFGIPVYVHWSNLFLPLVALARDYPEPFISTFIVVLFGPALILMVLLHELGKVMVTRAYGGTVESIVLWPLGGLTVFGPQQGGASAELKIGIIGSFIHVPIIGILAGIYALLTGGDMSGFQVSSNASISRTMNGFAIGIVQQLYKLNVLIILSNLIIPTFPLDGGRIMGALFMKCGMATSTAAKITSSIGVLMSLAGTAYGCYLFFFLGSFGALFELVVGIYLVYTSTNTLIRSATGTLSDDPIFGGPCYVKKEDVNFEAVTEKEGDVV
eukprot:CAMPEP_0194351886 /NCGR_PEP_ID=MMETSP0174-20130528/262_1 /TAXON_ID=216777 /ORGANISM="Proboscia alata, Strain PI-D3" /LENGTH=285 /DNA_ID=CAMNT_0039119617 /DNA_START=46 /DNA_END=903 /DNA_ORIENTATION=+